MEERMRMMESNMKVSIGNGKLVVEQVAKLNATTKLVNSLRSTNTAVNNRVVALEQKMNVTVSNGNLLVGRIAGFTSANNGLTSRIAKIEGYLNDQIKKGELNRPAKR